MEFEPFVRAAYRAIGGELTDVAPGVLQVITPEGKQYARLRDDVPAKYAGAAYIAPGSPSFLRLVDRVTTSGLHDVDDLDEETLRPVDEVVRAWTGTFDGKWLSSSLKSVRHCFTGNASVRVRASTAHDSFERIVDVPCNQHSRVETRGSIDRIPDLIRDPLVTGLDADLVGRTALKDADVQEFTRFYLERRSQEIVSAGGDERKRKKLEDEFTPRNDLSLVGLQGTVQRQITTRTRYLLDDHEFESEVCVLPSEMKIVAAPVMMTCDLTGKVAPSDCFGTCAISKKKVLRHRLIRSDVSGRLAIPQFISRCVVSGKQVLSDEVGISEITGSTVETSLLKTCAVSGQRGEPEHFGHCDFSATEVLRKNLATSDVSGKRYRTDQRLTSVVSGRSGHEREFAICHETRQPILPDESERCAATGKVVRVGVLETCGTTGKRVLRDQLEQSAVSGKRVLKDLMVQSSLSDARFLEVEGIRSAYGKFCAPIEARACQWSGSPTHPDDLKTCSLMGLPVHFQYLTHDTNRLEVMQDLISGARRTTDCHDMWDAMSVSITRALKNQKCRIEAAQLSPDRRRLALCGEVKSLLGLRTRVAGVLLSLDHRAVVGRVVIAKRDTKGGGFRVE